MRRWRPYTSTGMDHVCFNTINMEREQSNTSPGLIGHRCAAINLAPVAADGPGKHYQRCIARHWRMQGSHALSKQHEYQFRTYGTKTTGTIQRYPDNLPTH